MPKILLVATITLWSLNGVAQDCERPKVTCNPKYINSFNSIRDVSNSNEIPKCTTFIKAAILPKQYVTSPDRGFETKLVSVKVDESLMVEIGGWFFNYDGKYETSQTVMFQAQRGVPFKVVSIGDTLNCVVE